MSIAGYLSPPIAGLAAVVGIQSGYPQSWFLFSAIVLALAIVFLVRNLWGFIWTAAVVVGCYFAVRYLPGRYSAIQLLRLPVIFRLRVLEMYELSKR